MPYKERLRNRGKLNQKKSNYQIKNWPTCNQALKNTGALTIWVGIRQASAKPDLKIFLI